MRMKILVAVLILGTNRAFASAEISPYALRQDSSCPNLDGILKIAAAQSRDRAWIRNLMCIRRVGNVEAIAKLLPLTSDKDERLASSAAGGIINCLRWHPGNALQTILLLLDRSEASVRNEALRYLGEAKWDESLRAPMVRIVRTDEAEANRIAAIYALAGWNKERGEIEKALKDESESVQGAARFALKNLDTKQRPQPPNHPARAGSGQEEPKN